MELFQAALNETIAKAKRDGKFDTGIKNYSGSFFNTINSTYSNLCDG